MVGVIEVSRLEMHNLSTSCFKYTCSVTLLSLIQMGVQSKLISEASKQSSCHHPSDRWLVRVVSRQKGLEAGSNKDWE